MLSPTPPPTQPAAPPQRFTLDEANRALPYVQRVVADIVDAYTQVMAQRDALDADTQPADTQPAVEQAYERAMDRLSQLVDELNAVGVELRDFELGVIDFPSTHDNRPVCWCWRLGEPAVDTWHDPDAGFTTRQPVATLLAA